MNRPDRALFFERIEKVFDGVPLDELSEDDLLLALTVAQHAADMALLEAERRGLIGRFEGMHVIPYVLPEGVDQIETILTRGRDKPIT
jgi:hypothetical protein